MLEALRNVTLEQTLLSSIIQGDAILEISETVKMEHFSEVSHQKIYEVCKHLDDRGSNINKEMVAIELAKIGNEYLNDLKMVISNTPSPQVKVLATELIEYHNKRELYKVSLEIQENLKQKMNSAFIIKQFEDKTVNLDIAIGTRARSYREREEELSKLPPLPKYQTGISFIDGALGGGITAGQLILVMGDPEAGKTILTTQILKNVSAGFLTLFFCFEFTVRQFIEVNAKRKKDWNKDNLQIIDDGYALSDVEREVKIWAKRGCKFVVIDSQMRVDNSEIKGTVEQMESEKFTKLAKLCHRLEITILFITQQGKEDTKGGVHTPMGSKKGGHEASQIWYIHKLKPKYDNDGNDENKEVRLLEISKNKQNGKHFKTEVSLNPVVLEFYAKYNKEPKVTTFTSGKKGDIPVEIIEEKNKYANEIPDIEIPQIL